MEHPIWITIPGYEGYYDISNKGEIKSVDRIVSTNHHQRKLKSKVLKQRINKHGYLIVDLSRDSKTTTFEVHRLAAKAFIEILEGKNCVNHINGNKLDNRVCNLEWVTHSENIRHAINLNLYSSCKMVINKCTGKLYHSIFEASKNENISYSKLKRVFKANGHFNCLKLVA